LADALVRDVGAPDTQVVPVVDARSIDTTAPNPVPDAQIVVDTAVLVIPDAATVVLPTTPAVRVMGAGFCSVNPTPNSAPGFFALFLVAAFGLLIVRRRR
jgi:MYXO-CTERM domain-containing protein